MGLKRTWYIDEVTLELLNEVKINNNFKSMSQVFDHLLEIEKKYKTLKDEPLDKKLKHIDYNIEMILEMVAWQGDKLDAIPITTYEEGISMAYNKTKEIVDKKIEEKTKSKREMKMFE